MIPRTPAARAAWITFAATLPVYLATMNRTIGFIDRGELAAAACTLGIAHAPGYPTLMLAAGALTHLVPLRPVLVLNAFAALLTAAGAAVLVLLLDRVLRAVAGGTMDARGRAVYAAIGALFAATTMTWWEQANGFEVYALHALLMPLVVLLCLRWLDACSVETCAADDGGPSEPAWVRARRAGAAFALVTGLSFTNHLTTALLAPGLVAVAVHRLGFRTAFWKRILRLTPWFVAGLLPYAWLPVRAATHPRFDWGDPETLRAFLHHVTAADYHNRLFSDPASVAAQVRYLLWRVPWDQAWIGLVIAGLGALLLARRARPLAVMAGLLVACGFAFAAGYRIPDIDAYLLTITLGLAICFTAGIALLRANAGARLTVSLGIALVLVNGALHRADCDERGNDMAEAFVHDMIGPLPPNALLISRAWDVGVAASCYFQAVEGYRADVTVFNPDLALRSWYLDSFARRAPALAARCRKPLERYRRILAAVENGGPCDPDRIEAGRDTFLVALAAGAMRDHPVFSTEPFRAAPASWRPVPWLLAIWLRTDSSYVAEPPHRFELRPWAGRPDQFMARACWGAGVARLQRARYEAAYGRLAASRAIVRGIHAFDPHIRPERVGPLPLGTERTVLSAARFFRTVDAAPLAAAGP